MSSRAFKFTIIGAVIATLFLILCVSCSQPATVAYSQQPVYAQQPVIAGQAPVVVQQAPVIVQQNHDGLLTGMMLGHMMSGGGSTHTTTIVHAAPAPVYRPAPAPIYRPTPVYRPSVTTNSRGVSTSVSRSGGISVSSGRRR